MIFLPKRSSSRASSSAGFSLVEVALAVAIAALAIITLLGLLPQGLEMARKTSVITNNSSILEQIIRNLENMQWSDIEKLRASPNSKYYTDEGLEVGSDSKEISYVAQIIVKPTSDTSLPAADQNQQYLARVVINLASSSNTNYQFTPANRISYVVFNHLIAKSR